MAVKNKISRRPGPVRHANRWLGWLGAIIIALIGLSAAGVFWGGGTWNPKLALDLEGGTEIILAPKISNGTQATADQLNQAVSIIRQRVDASGVSESEIATEGNNVVVRIPGKLDDATRNRIESSAKMFLRPVILAGQPTTATATPTTTATPAPNTTATTTTTPTPTAEAAPSATQTPAATPSPGATPSPSATPSTAPKTASDISWVTPAIQAKYDAFKCSDVDSSGADNAPNDQPLVTCDTTGTEKYVLGPVEVSGESIADATSGQQVNQQGAATGGWAIRLVFNAEGTKTFADVSTRLVALKAQNQAPRDRFAFVLDGRVLTAPTMNGTITDGRPEITGNFTQASAKALADQLKFGALPISFTVQSSNTISATLGSSQLQSGLIAGLIGLLLVVIYTLFQYRLLGLVTIASLVIAAIITYLTITILSWRQGYRLSLSGIAGLIVAIGFTADSFIVYFERVRDELRDGRPLVAAVEAGWKRAYRTVLASKSVNLIAAIVLYVLAVGSVKGFAYTLGLTTVIDVIVVFLFTHPMLQLLAHTKFFSSGSPITGLDPNALGAVYRGRAQFRKPEREPVSKVASSHKEAVRRQTIAERKLAEQISTTKNANEES